VCILVAEELEASKHIITTVVGCDVKAQCFLVKMFPSRKHDSRIPPSLWG
jgi:hypothetical protein